MDSTPEVWQPVINDWKRSGLSGAAYCREHNLTYHRFCYWQQKFAEQTAGARSKFVSVRAMGNHVDAGLELRLPNGMVLSGITANNAATVAAVLRYL